MFNELKASPIRSTTKSGNSTTSSNSVRSQASPKMVSSGQTSRNVSASTVKARGSTLKSENSPQSSFEEEEVDAPVPEGLVRCDICKRNFAEDRIEKHQSVCQKTKTKKRKVYDASKKRVQVGLMKRKRNFKLIALSNREQKLSRSTENQSQQRDDLSRRQPQHRNLRTTGARSTKILSRQFVRPRKCKHIWPRAESCRICRPHRRLRTPTTFNVHIVHDVSMKQLLHVTFRCAKTCKWVGVDVYFVKWGGVSLWWDNIELRLPKVWRIFKFQWTFSESSWNLLRKFSNVRLNHHKGFSKGF